MATRKRVRYTIDINFSNQEEKDVFQTRLKSVKERLSTGGCVPDNRSFMDLCLEALESRISHGAINHEEATTMVTQSFMRNSG